MVGDNKNNGVTSSDILEFLKEHMVMNEDFDNGVKKLDDKLSDKIQKLDDKLSDKIQKSEDKIMARLAEMQSELEYIRLRLDDIEKRLKDDTDALVLEVQKLKKRVGALEQQLGMPRMAVQV